MAALSLSVTAVAQQTTPAQTEELEEVVVTGVRESLVQGLENKRAATQVVESIVAEDIGKLPDNNVVEALQRIAGIQITNRGGGEADAIVIRGLNDTTTTWNGRNVFTANSRQLALQDIPANLVSRIDVYKTRAADQLETGLAGQIDVATRRPFDFPGAEFSVNARAEQQEQRDSIDPNVSILASNVWETDAGKFGVLGNVSYRRTRYRDQSVTAGALVPFLDPTNATTPQGLGASADSCNDDRPYNPDWVPFERIFNSDCRLTPPGGDPPLFWQAGLDAGLSASPGSTINIGGTDYPYVLGRDALFASDFEGDRKRPAANLALQWAPNETSEYTFEAFYQGYREEMFNSLHFTFADWWGSLGANPASTYTLYPGTNLIKTRTVGAPFGFNSGDSTEQNTDTFVYALNGKWKVNDRLTLVADLSLQDSEFETDFIAVRTERVPQSVTVDFNAGGGIPSWHFNNDAELLDPSVWTVGALFQNKSRQEGGAQTLQLDGDYELGDGLFRTLSFGVRYDDRDAELYSPKPTPEPFLGRNMSTLPAGMITNNSGFMDGEADVPTAWTVVNGYYLNDHANEVRALYGVGAPLLLRAFDVQEKTSSVYLQTDLEIGKLQGQLGVRYVSVDTDMGFTNVITDVGSSASKSVNDLLPSLTLRYAVTDDVTVRFNYGETLRRPAFTDLNSNFALTGDLTQVGYGTGTGGNPDLEAAQAKNYDLTVEWYFATDSAVYATGFRREIDGLVVPLTRRITIANTGLNTDQFVVTQPVNASDGTLDGIELGFVYFPDYLPGFLQGLGATGSFTKLNSEQTIPLTNSAGEIIGEDKSEFFGVSDKSYNLTLAYDRAGVGARLSYVWRDDSINRNEARIFANPIGIWRAAEESLDLQVSYDVNENLALSFDAVNLTEEIQQEYYAFGGAGGPTTHNFGNVLISRQFALGVRWRY